jgi:hypothetical protein
MILKSQTFDSTRLRFDPEGCIPSRPEEGGLSAVEWVKNKRGRHFIPSPFIRVEED